MFGRHPLAQYEGVPIKDVLERLRGKEGSKNKETWNELQQMYMPPGVVKSSTTTLEKNLTLHNDIRSAIPKNTIYKRVKIQRSISTKTNLHEYLSKQRSQLPPVN